LNDGFTGPRCPKLTISPEVLVLLGAPWGISDLVVFMASTDGEEDIRQSTSHLKTMRFFDVRGANFRFSQLSLNSMDRAEASQTYQDWQQRWTPSQGADHAGHPNL